MGVLLFANNATTVLAAGISSGATSAVLSPGTGSLFPNPISGQYFVMTFKDATTQLLNEIVWVTARSGDTLTIVRAQEGTSAQAWSANDIASNLWTAGQAAAMLQQAQGTTINTFAGNPNGNVAGVQGDSSLNLPPTFTWDITDGSFWVCTTTGSSSTAVWARIASGNLSYWQDTGTANAMVITPSPRLAAYAAGVAYIVRKSGSASTGAATMRISGLVSRAVTYADGVALGNGAWAANAIAIVVDDGTALRLVTAPGAVDALTVLGALSSATLSVSGAASVGSLAATGAITGASAAIAGAASAASLSVAGTATVNALSTASVTASGTVSAGTLTSTGAANVSGLLTTGSFSTSGTAATGALTVTGAAHVSGTATVGALSTSGLASVGSFSTTGTAFTGALTVTGGMAVSGLASVGSFSTTGVAFTGALTVTGGMAVSGLASVGSFSTTGTAFTGALTVTGGLSVSSTVTLSSSAHVIGNFQADGAVTLSSSLHVVGNAAFDGNVTLGNLNTDTVTFTSASVLISTSLNFASGLLFLNPFSSNIGIGTTSPNSNVQMHIASAAVNFLQITNSVTTAAANRGLQVGLDNSGNTQFSNRENLPSIFSNNAGNETMRLLPGGAIIVGNNVGATMSLSTSNTAAGFMYQSEQSGWFARTSTQAKLTLQGLTNASQVFQAFLTTGSTVGSISYNGTNTLYNATSDRWVKDDIEDLDPSAADAIIAKLQPRSFLMKQNPSAGKRVGFVAQEVFGVMPEIVMPGSMPIEATEAPDIDAEDFVPWQGDWGAPLAPIVVQALKNLYGRVADLERRLAAH